MESRVFIREAANLMREIDDHQLQASTGVGVAQSQDVLQKRVSQLFSALQNPSLPSAYKLRDKAQSAGLTVAPAVLQRIAQFE